jgi:hypothetical protein
MGRQVLKRLRLVVLLVSVVALVFQATAAGLCAVACMKACEQASARQSSGMSCHGESGDHKKGGTKQECGGACSYLCVADKPTTLAGASAVQSPVFEMPTVLPSETACEFAALTAAPDLFRTDSSPPARAPDSTHCLRAPPALCA